MDLYLDTNPNDQAEEIRERVREQDGSDSEGRPRKGARADTRTSPIANGATSPS